MGVTMSGLEDRRAALAAGQGIAGDRPDVAAQSRDRMRQQIDHVMDVVSSFGNVIGSSRMQRAIKASHLICISFVFIAPVLLFWSVALGG